MKYKLSILLITALAAVSCSREKTEPGGGGTAAAGISFATRLDETRGTMTNSAANLADAGGFNVWAIGHKDSWAATPVASKNFVMNETAVTSSDHGATWSYAPEAMWPMDRYVSFFAYGPAASATAIAAEADGTPGVSFTVNAVVADQDDFVIATPVKDQAGAVYSYGMPVCLTFKHTMARVSFSGLLADPTDTKRIVKVKKIVMNGLYDSGTTQLTTDPVAWTVTGDADASYELDMSDGTTRELADTPLTTTGVAITTSSGYLFLMPQHLARPADDPTMDVTLSISEDDGDTFHDVTYSSVVFSPDAWAPGKSYNYQIILDKNQLRIIHIEIDDELVDWSPSVVLETIYLTSEDANDESNFMFAMNALNTLNTLSVTHKYLYYGIYAVNDVLHDITIDFNALTTAGFLSGYYAGEYLLFDLKKLIRVWSYDGSPSDPWTVKVINYKPGEISLGSGWELAPAMQTIPASYDVDGVTSATLPATLPKNGGGTVNVPISDELTAAGSIILKKL